VTFPQRGDWLEPGEVMVTGTVVDAVSGVADVTVNGTAATIDGDTFSALIDAPFGLSVLDVRATDANGAAARDARAMMAGDRTPTGTWIEDGIIVRMADADEGLGALGDSMMALFDARVLVDALPTPLVSDSSRVCTTVFGVRVCTTYSLTASLGDVGWADATLDLDPMSDGTLNATMTFTDVSLPWTASGAIASAPYSGSGIGSADSLELGMVITFDVVDHVIDVEIRDVTVSANALDLALPAWVDSVSSTLGVDAESAAIDALEAAANEEFPALLEANLEESLQALGIDVTWNVSYSGGASIRMIAEPSAINVDDAGLDVTLASSLASIDWSLDEPDGGVLTYGYGTPDWSTLPHSAAMGVSVDTYNQIFYGNWGTGTHRRISDADYLDVDMAVFASAFPGISDLVVTTRAYLPPTLIAREDGYDFDFPNIEFRLYNGDAVPGEEVYIIHVSSFTRGVFTMTRGELDITWDRPVITSHIERAPAEADLSFLDAGLESMFAGLNLNGSSHLGTLPLPSIAGYALNGTDVVAGGTEGGFIVIGGGLTAP
jgi:hypothetical protein